MKVLVVAFDGMDYELIEEFGLENIKQEEYGKVDNSTDIRQVKTSELFASFITGVNYTEHGVLGLKDERAEKTERFKKKIIDTLIPPKVSRKIRGLETLRLILQDILKPGKASFSNKDSLKASSLFEEIENSRAIYIPAYNPSAMWSSKAWTKPMSEIESFGKTETSNFWRTREYEHRKRTLKEEIRNDIVSPRDFLMAHFHIVDVYQHLFESEERLLSLYRDMDKFASEISELALEAGYDYIIFMSDHGLPTETEHNENAFYSCNRELFPDETPHITDFHDKILELVE